MKRIGSILIAVMISLTAFSQVKQVWNHVEIVSVDGKTLKQFETISSTSFINDSIFILYTHDEKLLGLLSNPSQSLLDETLYRIYKRNGEVSYIEDSVGTVYRYPYKHIVHNTQLVVMVDDDMTFVMIHPSPHVGIVFHNKKGRRNE